MIPIEDMKRQIDLMGREKIALIAVEEMAELQKEILKNINRGKDNAGPGGALFEEVADVRLLLEFVKVIYDITEEQIWKYQDKKHKEKWLPRLAQLERERNGQR
ncbi:MAG: hypothetical protein LBL46_00580 [Rickettsiales bacterium]|jgi:hypothetical protein|nr:hypothetical protein [Rickettsiales bacterium]